MLEQKASLVTVILVLVSTAMVCSQDLTWLGTPGEDFLPPGDITVQKNNNSCSGEIFQSSTVCMWEGTLEGEMMSQIWDWQLLEGVHYRGNDIEVIYSHVPCTRLFELLGNQSPLPELVASQEDSTLVTEVCVTLRDTVTFSELEYCWNVTIECGSCGTIGRPICTTCEEAERSPKEVGCRICDAAELSDERISCTPPCGDPACPPLEISSSNFLCGQDGFQAHNMSWFSFIATSEMSYIRIEISNCIGNGVQSGIYPSCDLREPCVGFNVNCATQDITEYEASFEIGQQYYLFVDGCNGSECEFEIVFSGQGDNVLDKVDHVTAQSICTGTVLTDIPGSGINNASLSGTCFAADKIVACPGEIIQFGARHQGDAGLFAGYDAPCDTYSPTLAATYFWSASWGAEWEYNPVDENSDEVAPHIELPVDEGLYSICLDFIEFECVAVSDAVCLDIEVQSGTEQTYYEDLDGDGYGSAVSQIFSCPAPAGYVCIPGDCDDNDPSVFPDSPELPIQVCDDGDPCTKNDIQSVLVSGTVCIPCVGVLQTCSSDSVVERSCDDLDPLTINDTEVVLPCDGSICVPCQGISLTTIDEDGDGTSALDDCDDRNPNVFPGNPEVCDSLDNNCNGMIDEGFNVPLLPVITCSISDDGFIVFSWPHSPNTIAYKITIDGEDRGLVFNKINDNIFELNEVVNQATITVEPISDSPSCITNIAEQTCAFSSVEGEEDSNLQIFPNPVSNLLYIEGSQSPLIFRIYDVHGRLVSKGNEIKKQILTSELLVGTYLLVLQNEDGDRVVKRIVKM